MIPLFKVFMDDRAGKTVNDVLYSGFIGQGPQVDRFEQALADDLGTANLATVNSATSGLHLALHMVAGRGSSSRADGTDPGEVLTTPLTCTATNWPILANDLRIRWVDIDPLTLNVDLDDLARKVSPATRAIVVVHWSGYPVDLARLSAILDEAEAQFGFRPTVIEDCAHAWGSTYRGRRLGNDGNVAVYSFQAIKHVTCGDGGLVVLPDAALTHRARMLRWYGLDRTRGASLRCENDVTDYGFKFHMNDISATIGMANLRTAHERVARHRDNAAYYDRELKDVPGIQLTERAADRESSFWIYTVLVDRRAEFISRLAAAGIASSPVHLRNDLHTCVQQYRSILPNLAEVAPRVVSIPVGWWVTDEQREHIADVIRSGW